MREPGGVDDAAVPAHARGSGGGVVFSATGSAVISERADVCALGRGAGGAVSLGMAFQAVWSGAADGKVRSALRFLSGKI